MHEVAVTVGGDVHGLVQVLRPRRIDGDELDVATVLAPLGARGLRGLVHRGGHAEDPGVATTDDGHRRTRPGQVEGEASPVELDGVAAGVALQALALRHPRDVGRVADDVVDPGEHLARLRREPVVRARSEPDDVDGADGRRGGLAPFVGGAGRQPREVRGPPGGVVAQPLAGDDDEGHVGHATFVDLGSRHDELTRVGRALDVDGAFEQPGLPRARLDAYARGFRRGAHPLT